MGGTSAAARNLISGNNKDGIAVNVGASNVTVQGNYIGVNAAATGAVANGGAGVLVNGSSVLVGGTAAGAGNIISGNAFSGINLVGATQSVITGNLIGLGADGVVAIGNAQAGVRIAYNGATTTASSNNKVGGANAGEGNVIAGNQGPGIWILNNGGTGNSFLGNAIHDNTGLGIDLDPDGVSANDTGDGDTGANNLQNFPIITSVTQSGQNITIAGVFNSTASSSYRLEFFSNASGGANTHGQGQNFLGYTAVTTDASGNASYSVVLSAAPSGNAWISATATSQATNDTSEFALSVQNVVNNPPVGTAHTVSNKEDVSHIFTVGNFGFTDPNDSPANTFLGVVITTIPVSGSLMLNNVAVTAGTFIQRSDISSGALAYVPLANVNGTNVASFTFQVRDNGGGDDTDTTPRVMTINLTSVNDAPIGADHTLNLANNTPYAF
ncbi:MAG: beta strand repeat-containing protein, partial [Janthinobacterium lividum]